MRRLGNKTYSIEYLLDVVDKEISALSNSAKELIINAINERLTVDQIAFGKPLRYSLKGYRNLRVNRYRVVYRIEYEKQTVVIHAIHHRKNEYDN